MVRVKVIKNNVIKNFGDGITAFHVETLSEDGIISAVYYLPKGCIITLAHDGETDGKPTEPNPNETIVNTCVKGKVSFSSEKDDIVLGLYDSVELHAIDRSFVIESLEDSIIVSSMTDNVNTNSDEEKVLDGLMKEIDARDQYTRTHCNHVSNYAQKIAILMNIKTGLLDIADAGSLHDIGKTNIPDEVLLKPGALNNEEFAVIKQHPVYGYDILKKFSFNDNVLKYVVQHHERLDGSGYPYGLKGDDLCIESRILAVADVFDALTTNRVYRKAFSVEKAIAILSEDAEAGKMDKDVVNALKNGVEQGKILLVE